MAFYLIREWVLSSALAKLWGIGTIEYLKLESVLNESAVFAFNALTKPSLNWSETRKYMQVKFHSVVEFTTHFSGSS
jgi:hypothetical protein